MAEAGGQERNIFQRVWWLIVLLALLFIFLCVFVGPGKSLLTPQTSTEPPVTEKATEPPPTDKPTEVVTEEPTEKATETEKPTEKPTEKATETEKPTEPPVIFTEEPTEPVCSADPTDGFCDVACGENQGTDPACGPAPNCGSDCSATGYCGDGSNGLFCDNGTCNGVQCETKDDPKPLVCETPNDSKRCCKKYGGTWKPGPEPDCELYAGL
jgi:hypothetical protein